MTARIRVCSRLDRWHQTMRLEALLFSPVYSAMRWAGRRARIVRALFPEALTAAIHHYLAVRALGALPERRYLEDQILPALARAGFRRVLFVGCRRYTRHYGRYFDAKSTEYWTADYDPAAAAWGAAGRHLICDIRAIRSHVAAGFFDMVVLNGVFGFGVNDEPSMNETLAAIHDVLIPGGRLLVGWDQRLIPDPSGLANMRRLFHVQAIGPLPAHQAFSEYQEHVYDFFVALPA
jgi:SAM-dependent methyltransferase